MLMIPDDIRPKGKIDIRSDNVIDTFTVSKNYNSLKQKQSNELLLWLQPKNMSCITSAK